VVDSAGFEPAIQSLLLYLLSYSVFNQNGNRTHDTQIMRHFPSYMSEYNHHCTMELYRNSQLWTCTDKKATSSTHCCDIFLLKRTTFCPFIIIDDAKVKAWYAVFLRSKNYFQKIAK